MKNILYLLFIIFLSSTAQVPQSPEVAAFEKYGAVAVNLYTESPSASIPIYNFQGKEISLPISLTYDFSGIKVDQIATNVGLDPGGLSCGVTVLSTFKNLFYTKA